MKSTINCQFKYERRAPLSASQSQSLSQSQSAVRQVPRPQLPTTAALLHCRAMAILKQQPQVACVLQQQRQQQQLVALHCALATAHTAYELQSLRLTVTVRLSLLSHASPSGCRE